MASLVDIAKNENIHWIHQLMLCTILVLLIRSGSYIERKIFIILDNKIMFSIDATKHLANMLTNDNIAIRNCAVKAVSSVLTQYKPIQPRKEILLNKKRFTFEDIGELSHPKNEDEWKQTIFYDKRKFCEQ